MDYTTLPRTINELDNLDLSYINDNWNKNMIRDGMQAIIRTQENLKNQELDIWKYLHDYSTDGGKGFMFSNNEIVNLIVNNMETSHSGSSLGFTMSQLEFIAKFGIESFRQSYIST